jgi:hypothetical protein
MILTSKICISINFFNQIEFTEIVPQTSSQKEIATE